MSETYWDVVVDHLCDLERYVLTLFGLTVTLFLVMIVSLTVAEPGSATSVIVLVDMVLLVVTAIASLAVLVACRRRRQRKYE